MYMVREKSFKIRTHGITMALCLHLQSFTAPELPAATTLCGPVDRWQWTDKGMKVFCVMGLALRVTQSRGQGACSNAAQKHTPRSAFGNCSRLRFMDRHARSRISTSRPDRSPCQMPNLQQLQPLRLRGGGNGQPSRRGKTDGNPAAGTSCGTSGGQEEGRCEEERVSERKDGRDHLPSLDAGGVLGEAGWGEIEQRRWGLAGGRDLKGYDVSLHVDAECGDDEKGDGTRSSPYASIFAALSHAVGAHKTAAILLAPGQIFAGRRFYCLYCCCCCCCWPMEAGADVHTHMREQKSAHQSGFSSRSTDLSRDSPPNIF